MAQLAAFWAKLTMLVSTIRFSDIVDILIVAYLIYNVIMLIRKTNSYRLAQGVLLILIALWLSGVLKLTMFNRILQKTVELGLIALVIIFQPELRRLLASKEGDPRFFFAQYASGAYDPRVGAGDLGDDLFRSVALQSANLKYVAEHGDEWLSGRDGDYKFREELLTDMVLRVNALASQLMRYIGGVYMNPVYEGTARPA